MNTDKKIVLKNYGIETQDTDADNFLIYFSKLE